MKRVLELKCISKMLTNGDVAPFYLRDISLEVVGGECFVLFGPSGCGKTTLLKVVAGLLAADDGQVWFDGREISRIRAEQREFAMVFQQPLLFPHMTVRDNLAYGLKVRKRPKKQRWEIAETWLERMEMSGFGDRYPAQLSGGQQQRVALARALACEPKLLLLDEPFSALDYTLRLEMRELLRRLHRELSIPMLLVTHDREEALSLADRLAVMKRGQIIQTGTPADVYYTPCEPAVAGALGVDQWLFIAGRRHMIRPEQFRFASDSADTDRVLTARITDIRMNIGFYQIEFMVTDAPEALHQRYRMHWRAESSASRYTTQRTILPAIGETVNIYYDAAQLHVIPEKKETNDA